MSYSGCNVYFTFSLRFICANSENGSVRIHFSLHEPLVLFRHCAVIAWQCFLFWGDSFLLVTFTSCSFFLFLPSNFPLWILLEFCHDGFPSSPSFKCVVSLGQYCLCRWCVRSKKNPQKNSFWWRGYRPGLHPNTQTTIECFSGGLAKDKYSSTAVLLNFFLIEGISGHSLEYDFDQFPNADQKDNFKTGKLCVKNPWKDRQMVTHSFDTTQCVKAKNGLLESACFPC